MVATNELRAGEKLKAMDPIWDSLREEARVAAEVEPLLAAFLYSTVLNHRSLEESVIHRVCERLDHPDMQANLLHQIFDEMLDDWPEWGSVLRVDIQAVYDRDPACLRFLDAVLYFDDDRRRGRISCHRGKRSGENSSKLDVISRHSQYPRNSNKVKVTSRNACAPARKSSIDRPVGK